MTFLFGLPLVPSKLQAYAQNEIILDIFKVVKTVVP
jgi:hypothetical protein